MSCDLNSFLAGILFEKMNRMLRVAGNNFIPGNNISVAIHVPTGGLVDIEAVKDSFHTVFQMYDITNAYRIDNLKALFMNQTLSFTIKLCTTEDK